MQSLRLCPKHPSINRALISIYQPWDEVRSLCVRFMLKFSIQIHTVETFDGSWWWRECWLQKDFESEAELSDSERHMSRPWGLHDKLYFPQLNSISVWRVRIMKAAGFCFVLFCFFWLLISGNMKWGAPFITVSHNTEIIAWFSITVMWLTIFLKIETDSLATPGLF